jgi:hypothetical protein
MSNLNECFSKLLKKNNLLNAEDMSALDNFVLNEKLTESVEGLLWIEKILKKNDLISEKDGSLESNKLIVNNKLMTIEIRCILWLIRILHKNELIEDEDEDKRKPSKTEQAYYKVEDTIGMGRSYLNVSNFIKLGTGDEINKWLDEEPSTIGSFRDIDHQRGPFIDELDAIMSLWEDYLW